MRKCLVLLIVCIYSSFSIAQNVGVGVTNPQNKLHVGGGFRLDTLTGVGGAGLVRHDVNGVVYGIKFSGNVSDVLRGDGTFGSGAAGSIGWLLNGNSGTDFTTHFLGTTDNQPLSFRVNNIRHGYLSTSNIFFGQNAGKLNTGEANIGIGNGALGNNTLVPGLIGIGDSALHNNAKSVIPGSSDGTNNTAIGYKSLYSNTTGFNNTATGYLSLKSNSIGHSNAAFGNSTLSSNTTGTANTALGNWALLLNTTGARNTAVGNEALSRNTNGTSNTATGYFALLQNTIGFANAAFGSEALYANINGFYNTAIGYRTLNANSNGVYNTAIGANAMLSNTTGYMNVAIGGAALQSNSGGIRNTSIGTESMISNTTGYDNTAVGYGALNKNTTAFFNTSVGAFSSNNNTVGTFNVSVGYKALEQNINGAYNTAVGQNALQGNISGFGNSAFGSEALQKTNAIFADGNSAFGANALWSNTIGSFNTGMGRYAGYLLPNNVSNVTVIGYLTGWNTTSSNQVNIGNFSVSWIGGQTGWFHYSDKRIKNDIKDDVPGLSFITRLKPLTYHVDIDKQEEIANAGKNETNSELIKPTQKDWEGKYDVEKIKMTGFFAQDVEDAAKAINYSFSGVHNPKNGGLYSLDYSAFVVPLVKAVQEQQAIIGKQQQRIDDLLKRIEALEKK